jgi:hypothetical protein
VQVTSAGGHGVGVGAPGGNGVDVIDPGGHGVNVSQADSTNANDGFHSVTTGSGFGVYGKSRQSDGVFGETDEAATFNFFPYIVGGVHGKPKAVYFDDADNFAVVGSPDDNSATGVLGIGGLKGHGVVGISGGEPGFTTAGVRGFTREGVGWPPPLFPITPMLIKEEVGVLGQTGEYVGVWGESLHKMGMVGTVGRQLQYPDLLDSIRL